MSGDGGGFDPSRWMTKISGKDYLPVAARLLWLRTEHPEASVVTDCHHFDAKGLAVFVATVTLPSGASASGWGMETSDNFADYLEKAETKALGRALGALGLGTQFAYDLEDGPPPQQASGQRQNDRGYTGESHAYNANPSRQRDAAPGRMEATPRQIKYLYAVAREVGISNEALEQRARDTFGDELAALGRRDVSTLIEQMQAERAVNV